MLNISNNNNNNNHAAILKQRTQKRPDGSLRSMLISDRLSLKEMYYQTDRSGGGAYKFVYKVSAYSLWQLWDTGGLLMLLFLGIVSFL